MPDLEDRSFRRTLTITLTLLGLLTAGSVLLFGHLLFKSLSKDVVADALLRSRRDAERVARGVAEKAGADLGFTLQYRQKEIDSIVGSTLERQIVNDVEVRDRQGKVLYRYGSILTNPETVSPPPPEGRGVTLDRNKPLVPEVREASATFQIADPYNIEVPIGDFATLRVGVSRRELEGRVEKLREKLYQRTFAAAIVSLLGIAAASGVILLLFRKTRRIEAARVEAERRAELGEVAAGLAHEIRNPLNAMGLNLELLEEQLQRTAKGDGAPAAEPNRSGSAFAASAAELAQAARQESGRLARLLTDFLAYAKPAPLAPVPSDLNEPAAEAVSFLLPEAERRKIRLDFTPHPGGASSKLDVGRVKQVVMNLVANALDAVESEGAASREVHVKVEEDGAFWKITVSDRGPGLRDAEVSDLFRVFVSTKPAGTGLGLPIAERIVKAHGGTLTLESSEGEPTRAVATFPRS